MEYSQTININAGDEANALIFTPDGKYIVSGGKSEGVQVWRVKDGRRVATMKVSGEVRSVTVSKDGRFIGAGSLSGEVLVWDATNYEQVFADKIAGRPIVWDVDFSPDSKRLISVDYNTATIWDIEARRKVQTLDSGYQIAAAKYSPQGDRITVATRKSVQVYSDNGQLLLNVEVQLEPWRGLLWFNNHLFVKIGYKKIRQIDASTGSTVSEWSVPSAASACIALSQHGRFLAHSTENNITFWDTSTHTKLGLIPRSSGSRSMAFSEDDRLVMVVQANKIAIKDLYFIVEPDIRIQSAALHAWKNGQLMKTDALLTSIPCTKATSHHVRASRALVHARLRQWDAALADTEKSIKDQPSALGYIAKCVALVGKGDIEAGRRVCDIASLLFRDHVAILLLIKAVVLFMAGEHSDALSRIDDLITVRPLNATLYVVQAYMRLLYGNLYMESGNYNHAIQCFEDARCKLGGRKERPSLIISLISGWDFDGLEITIQLRLCEALLSGGRTKEASDSVLRIVAQEPDMSESTETWLSDFMERCLSAPENNVNVSFVTTGHSNVLHPMTSLLREWAKSRLLTRLWKDALIAARGFTLPRFTIYRVVCEQLEMTGHVADAVSCFYQMRNELTQNMDGEQANWIQEFTSRCLGKLEDLGDQSIIESSDPGIGVRSTYVTAEKTKETIRATIKRAIRDSPPVLIDTIHGRLCDKSAQASVFEATPTFAELISTMATHIDHTRVEQEVGKYFRYAAFSHTWEDNEPLFEKVVKVVVYDLERSPAHEKLQIFCKIVREAGFNWAWSDTCCINKGDHFVLQEALISMFGWYERSAMTLIYLRGVDRLAKLGALTRSIWNQRAWALQEYHASKVIRIYTEDWTPYLGLDIYNYKESPEIILEMEEATGISAQALKALRPGPDDIREKLRLASTRQTTRVEDAAYSLLGIFSASLPIKYGEGDKALGRLLAQLLTSSGDASILAWTGISGSFNSCLPSNITVFSQVSTSHIPLAVTDAEIGTTIARLRTLNPVMVADLYDRVNGVSIPLFIGRRIKLPCLMFKLGPVSVSQNRSERVFHAQTNALGIVEIQTQEDLSQLDSLCLVHPWLDFLLDRRPVESAMKTSPAESIVDDQFVMLDEFYTQANTTAPAPRTRAARLVARLGRTFGGHAATSGTDAASPSPPSTPLPLEKQTRVLQFVARLRRPFGALLLTPTRRNVDEYRRVAAESLITVQVGDLTPAILDRLVQGVRMLDVL